MDKLLSFVCAFFLIMIIVLAVLVIGINVFVMIATELAEYFINQFV
jgi:hypothetical protein